MYKEIYHQIYMYVLIYRYDDHYEKTILGHTSVIKLLLKNLSTVTILEYNINEIRNEYDRKQIKLR